MSMKLYVGNLSFDTSTQDLEQIFGEVGTVESTNIIEDRDTGRSRGFAFVEMSTKEEAQSAVTSLNGKEIDGRQLKVNEAVDRDNRSGTGNRGGGGGGGNRTNYDRDSSRSSGNEISNRAGINRNYGGDPRY